MLIYEQMTEAEKILYDLISWFQTGPKKEEEALLIDAEEFSAKAKDFNDIMDEAEAYFFGKAHKRQMN